MNWNQRHKQWARAQFHCNFVCAVSITLFRVFGWRCRLTQRWCFNIYELYLYLGFWLDWMCVCFSRYSYCIFGLIESYICAHIVQNATQPIRFDFACASERTAALNSHEPATLNLCLGIYSDGFVFLLHNIFFSTVKHSRLREYITLTLIVFLVIK